MTNAQKLTLELIRYEFTGIPLSQTLDTSTGALEEVYKISVSQGVSSIVGSALSKLNLLNGDIKQAFFNDQLANLYSIEQIKFELERICQLFEQEKIKFIPLKGSVLRDYYPRPEMRESCDVDVLIRKEDLERTKELLCQNLSYRYNGRTPHDYSFYSPTSVFLELHFALGESEDNDHGILNGVWDYAILQDGYKYKYKLDEAYFVAYHMIHIAKHITNGGCGIRPFLDLKIIEDNFKYDKNKLRHLLSQAGLCRFANEAFKTSKVWFGDEKTNETVDLLGDYVFSAGIYGNLENQMAASLARNGSKFKNLIDRIFLSYDKLKLIYPKLENKPYFMFWYQVKRWKRIIFKDKAKHQIAMIKYNANITDERKKSITTLMENLGLK